MNRWSRRRFLENGAWTGTALGLGAAGWPGASGAADGPPRVKAYRRLGRTGLEISDVSFGGSRLRPSESGVVEHALERGVNYFDTASSYSRGDSETVLGPVLKGRRDRIVLASKVKAEADARWPEMMRVLDQSLRRLQTDYIDIYFNHAINDLDRVGNPEWGEFVERARKAGKFRYSGVSGHGGRLVKCLDYVVDNDLVDVMLVGYNFGQDPAFYQKFIESFDFVAPQPDLPRVLERAREKDIGVIAMKTLRGAKLNDMRPYEAGGATFSQAAFRWVLNGGLADALIVTMRSREQVDEYLGASGAAAPTAVPIPEVLRTRMYAEDYADPDLGREDYARLGAGASACTSCASRACLDACPFGIDVPELTQRTHSLLRG